MGYFQVRYDSRVVNYDRRGFYKIGHWLYPSLLPQELNLSIKFERKFTLGSF